MPAFSITNEEWRPITGYEGLYEVSDQGRIRSRDRIVYHPKGDLTLKGKIRKIRIDKNGYSHITIYKEGISKTFLVHRLVAITFLGDFTDQGLEVRHGPIGNSDNSLSNLSWGTPGDNESDKIRDGTHHQAKKTHCPRKHLLEHPNLESWALKKNQRSCKACSLAKGFIRFNGGDLQEVSDNYYEQILHRDKRR